MGNDYKIIIYHQGGYKVQFYQQLPLILYLQAKKLANSKGSEHWLETVIQSIQWNSL